MEGSITWVGIDAHEKTLAVAVLSPGSKVADEFTIDNTEPAIRKLARRHRAVAHPAEVRRAFQDGPT